jgi:plastocyanin
MKPITKLATILAPVALLLPVGASGETAPQLIGTVGKDDANVIALADAAGQKVTKLDPGSYTLLVHDFSALHNFHVRGPGVDANSGIAFIGDKTFTITVADGQYTYVCDEHLGMEGSFTVGNPPPAPQPPTPVPAPAAKKATAAVTAAGAVTISPKPAKAGTYKVTVRDSSKTKNFHLVGPGVNRKTTNAFVGTVTWTVKLKAGTYRYGSDPNLTKTLRIT